MLFWTTTADRVFRISCPSAGSSQTITTSLRRISVSLLIHQVPTLTTPRPKSRPTRRPRRSDWDRHRVRRRWCRSQYSEPDSSQQTLRSETLRCLRRDCRYHRDNSRLWAERSLRPIVFLKLRSFPMTPADSRSAICVPARPTKGGV